MGRIGASLSGFELKLLNRLQEANAAATLNALRLTTGKRINSPRDNPSTFTAIEQFNTQLSTVKAAMSNVTAASSIVSQAQLNLDNVRTQLNTIRTKLIENEDGSLTADQKLANQAAIDTAIAEINSLASAEAGGKRVLDGSADFIVTGVNNSQISSIRVSSRGPDSAPTIDGSVTGAGTQATHTHTESGGTFSSAVTITLTGERGAASITIGSGDTVTQAVAAINAESHNTGVTAAVNGDDIDFTTVDYGTDAILKVEVVSGSFTTVDTAGTDATATINGQAYTADGNTFSVNDNGFTFTLEAVGGFTGTLDTVTVSGDALTFALTPDPGNLSTLAIGGVQAARLGGLSGTLDQLVTGGTYAGVDEDVPTAVRIVDEALNDLTRIDGAVDGFADAAIASSASLLAALEADLQDSVDEVNEVDDNAETLLLAKNQQLVNNAIASLSILSQQRSSVVAIIESIAGLR
jgi:flagellin-like hook-associated protein FlgL